MLSDKIKNVGHQILIIFTIIGLIAIVIGLAYQSKTKKSPLTLLPQSDNRNDAQYQKISVPTLYMDQSTGLVMPHPTERKDADLGIMMSEIESSQINIERMLTTLVQQQKMADLLTATGT